MALYSHLQACWLYQWSSCRSVCSRTSSGRIMECTGKSTQVLFSIKFLQKISRFLFLEPWLLFFQNSSIQIPSQYWHQNYKDTLANYFKLCENGQLHSAFQTSLATVAETGISIVLEIQYLVIQTASFLHLVYLAVQTYIVNVFQNNMLYCT